MSLGEALIDGIMTYLETHGPSLETTQPVRSTQTAQSLSARKSGNKTTQKNPPEPRYATMALDRLAAAVNMCVQQQQQLIQA